MKRCLCPLLPLIWFFAAVPLRAGADEPALSARKEAPPKYPVTELAVPDSVFKDTERHWMGVYFNGVKCGWAGRSIGPDTLDGKKCITAGETMVMEMKVFKQIIRTISITRTCYSTEAPYRALLMETTEKRGEQERHVQFRNAGGTLYTVDSTDGGKPRPQESAKFDARLCQETTTGVWAADPARKPGDAITVESFSIGRMKFGEQTLSIAKEADWESSGAKQRVWETSLYDFGDRTETFLRLSRESGSLVSGRYNSTIEFREEPEEVAKKIPAGELTDLFFATAIRADRKLPKTSSLSEIVLELTAPEGRTVPDLPDTASQTVERKAGDRVIVKTGPGTGPRQAALETDRAGFLKATARYPLADEAVKKLAARAVFGAKNDRAKVERLQSFTRTFIQPSAGAKPLTVMDVIQSKKGDCTAYALLFTTLARAAGIPAREAGGWMYMGDEYQAFGFHAWNEVILDGHWVPVDASCKGTFNAGHIQECSADGEGSRLREMVPGLKARVISCKTK